MPPMSPVEGATMVASIGAWLRSYGLFCAILFSCAACTERVAPSVAAVQPEKQFAPAGQRHGAVPRVVQRTCVSDTAGNQTCRETTQ